MYDILDSVPVAYDRVRFGNLAIDSRDARFERVSLQKKGTPLSSASSCSKKSERGSAQRENHT
jgi:hypothetical protein